QPLGSNAPLPSCVGPGLITPAQSASFRQLPASAMADASIISAEVATNNRRFICHPQKSVEQTGSLPGLPGRPHRSTQGKLPVCPPMETAAENPCVRIASSVQSRLDGLLIGISRPQT